MPPGFTFYLGTAVVGHFQAAVVPLFISRRVLARVARPRIVGPWALDSGGFTELGLHGRWVTPAGRYAALVRWWHDSVPGMRWAAVQDWMCEPHILAKTGLRVTDHQRLTIESYLRLSELQPRVPWVPVLQGYAPGEYVDHVRQYEAAGVNLRALPLVGIGSVCRRQSSDVEEAEAIIREIAGAGIRLHAFGFKATGLARCADALASADSMAWSYAARRGHIKLAGCRHRGNCANCLTFALLWRERVLATMRGRTPTSEPRCSDRPPPPRKLRAGPE